MMRTIQNIEKNNFMYKWLRAYLTKDIFVRHKTKTPLGRWQVKQHDKHIYLTIDYSNEDHCGSCAHYVNIKHYEVTEEDYTMEFELLNSIIPNMPNIPNK